MRGAAEVDALLASLDGALTEGVERVTSAEDIEACVVVLYRAFAGLGAPPVMILDWVAGTELKGCIDLFEPIRANADGVFVDNPEREKVFRYGMRWVVHMCAMYGVIFAIRHPGGGSKFSAVAACLPPGRQETAWTTLKMLWKVGLPPWERLFRSAEWKRVQARAFQTFRTTRLAEREIEPQPHWKLSTLGVDPALQQSGYGRRLLNLVNALADLGQYDVYLECSGARNEKIYRKFGFEVRRKVPVVPARNAGASAPFSENGGVCMMVRPASMP
mmetsp:Transcript_500/g.1715  ORF Transcript_500/g.1715 Transcript_500/m.1715 type:complete len:274 (+) Transcript_500:149-970(+)